MHGYMWIALTASSAFWDMINNALVSSSCRLNWFNRHLIWIIYAKQIWNFLRDSLKWSNAQGPFKAKYHADHIWIVMKGSKQVMRNTNLHITDLLFFIWAMHIRKDFPFYFSSNGHNQNLNMSDFIMITCRRAVWRLNEYCRRMMNSNLGKFCELYLDWQWKVQSN